MSRITNPTWRIPPSMAHVLIIDVGSDLFGCEFWEWCYENCKHKVIGLNPGASIVLDNNEVNNNRDNKFHSFSYGNDKMVVLAEDADDAMLIKLTWCNQ